MRKDDDAPWDVRIQLPPGVGVCPHVENFERTRKGT